jgi:hypothetical protein
MAANMRNVKLQSFQCKWPFCMDLYSVALVSSTFL